MPFYDRSFTPPAPVADVLVGHPVSGTTSLSLRGKLDTAADLTVIPLSVVAELDLPPRAHIWARSFDGTYSQRPIYYVRFRLEQHEVPVVVRCVATERTNVLVGRNVLNRFIITLNGQALRFDLRAA